MPPDSEHVILLHGLCRTPRSMRGMQRALQKEGYVVHNLGYDSRHHTIPVLAEQVAHEVRKVTEAATRVHFVTHSMGGILVRQMEATQPLETLGRVVMLSPPNHGSEVVDRIGHSWIFDRVNGPAGQQLGTAPDSFVNQLGPVHFECGVLTGDRSLNWINSCMIHGPNDGKVSVASARIEGMQSFKVAHATHTFMTSNRAVIADTIQFLKTGCWLP
ncbi:MAG: alpha/beta fold hydrolase [Puniceicoccaceae bacterium]|nr:MAG: alpha/beta fold hydrolase [Puniceicoccaceae bacterium]